MAGFQRKYPPFETIAQIKKWCDRQERAQTEVKRKLYSWGVSQAEADQLIAELISTNYLNDERFARAFARGKFRIKHWGKEKIQSQLKQKGISPYCIQAAMEEIQPHEYQRSLQVLIERKRPLIKASSQLELRAKLLRFALSKGFSYEDSIREIDRELAG